MGIREGWLRMGAKYGWVGKGGFANHELPWAKMSARLARTLLASACPAEAWESSPPAYSVSGIDLSGAEPESMPTMLEVARTGEFFASPPIPGGSAEVRQAVSKQIDGDRGIRVDSARELIVTEGATGALRAIAEAFVNRGDSVVMIDPGSPMHQNIMRFRGAEVRSVAARVNANGFHEVNLGAFTAAVHGARILLLSQPNNPDGGIWNPQNLGELKWWARRRDLLVVVDETYAAYLPEEHRQSLAADPGWGERILTVGSLSKSHAAAGARIGWVHGAAPLVAAIQRVVAIQGQAVSWPAEKAALRLLGSPGVAPAIRKRIEDHRSWAAQKLAGFGMRPTPSRAGIFLWFPTWNLNPSSRELVATLWEKCQVKLTPGEAFGPANQGHVRINLAGDPGRFQEGFNRLEKWAEGKELTFGAQPVGKTQHWDRKKAA